MDAGGELQRGREAYAERVWSTAWALLSRADGASPLPADDLELLATAAYMLGRDDDYVRLLERAHHAHLEVGDPVRAGRCAFWVGLTLAIRGEAGPASGWFGRAQRLLDRDQRDCVERGYLLVPVALRHEAAGEYDAEFGAAGDAAAIGERFGETDLFALAVHMQGHARLKQGRVEEGLRLLDEAMVAVTAGELSPIVTGIIYCSVIEGCQLVYELRRAREWTNALTQWCRQQPDLVAFTGRCLIHRAEVMQVHGEWRDALEEARRAGERCAQAMNSAATAEALYRQGELQRLQGQLDAAEGSYRESSRAGWEPQPGLALLRLAQGDTAAAAAAIRRAAGETSDPLKRARLLPARVEIALAAGALDEARDACRELEEISSRYESAMLRAMVAHATGAVDLARGEPRAALIALRDAWQGWQELEAPYEAARTRVLVGLACRELGDGDAAALELAAARGVFAELGAGPDLARVEALAPSGASRETHGLTPRELEVLRLVAAGATNKGIAAELVLSERTVDRHVSNIFVKLRVSSRSAATAYAYEHQLV